MISHCMSLAHVVYPFICGGTFGLLWVIVDDVAVHMGVQVFVGLFLVVSEELILVEWEAVSERPIMGSGIIILLDGGSGFPVTRE